MKNKNCYKNFKKKVCLFLLLSVLSYPSVGLAMWSSPDPQGLPTGSISGIIMKLMLWLLGLFGFLGIIGFVISGIIYLTSAGDDDRIETAKNAMTYSIIGVIVGLSGYVIIKAVQAALNGQTANF